MDQKLRVLVVDDTITYRKIVGNVLAGMPDVEVVGTAANGKIALEKIAQTRPDLLLLDLEMPEMDGIEVLRRLKAAGSPVGAIILSALTAKGSRATLDCLNLGAFDFILKPSNGTFEENLRRIRDELAPRVVAFARRREVRALLAGASRAKPPSATSAPVASASPPPSLPRATAARPEVVAIGISTGGPAALAEMLPRLPENFPAAVLIVQHMPPVFTRSLAEDLDRKCRLRVAEAEDGDAAHQGRVLIAPGGKQMKVCRQGDRVLVRITDDPPENSCRPSADYLFRSVASVYGPRAVALVMTGMGNDGSAGCREIKARGGWVLAQDAASCVVFGMPRQPIEEGIADVVAPLNRLDQELVRIVGKGSTPCA